MKSHISEFLSSQISEEPFEQETFKPEVLEEVKRLSNGIYFISPWLIRAGNIFSIILLAGYLTLNAVFYNPLYDMACDYVNFWGDLFLGTFTVDQVSKFSDIMVYYLGYGLLGLSVIFQQNRFLVTLQASYVCFGLKIGEVLKLIFFDGRPIYVCNNVYTGWCTANLGMPASHVLGATTVYLWITLFLVVPSNFFKRMSIRVKILIIFCLLACPVIVDITRLIMGAHTFMQNIAGYIFGITYTWVVYSQLIPCCMRAKPLFLYWKWHLLTWILNTLASAILTQLGMYTTKRIFPKSWILNLVEKACDMDYDQIEGSWGTSSLILFPWLSLSFGFLLSIGYKEYYPSAIPLYKERDNWLQYRVFWISLLIMGVLLFFYDSTLSLGRLQFFIRPALFYLIGMTFSRILKGRKHPEMEI